MGKKPAEARRRFSTSGTASLIQSRFGWSVRLSKGSASNNRPGGAWLEEAVGSPDEVGLCARSPQGKKAAKKRIMARIEIFPPLRFRGDFSEARLSFRKSRQGIRSLKNAAREQLGERKS